MNLDLNRLKNKLPSDEAEMQFYFAHCKKIYFPLELESEWIYIPIYCNAKSTETQFK